MISKFSLFIRGLGAVVTVAAITTACDAAFGQAEGGIQLNSTINQTELAERCNARPNLLICEHQNEAAVGATPEEVATQEYLAKVAVTEQITAAQLEARYRGDWEGVLEQASALYDLWEGDRTEFGVTAINATFIWSAFARAQLGEHETAISLYNWVLMPGRMEGDINALQSRLNSTIALYLNPNTSSEWFLPMCSEFNRTIFALDTVAKSGSSNAFLASQRIVTLRTQRWMMCTSQLITEQNIDNMPGLTENQKNALRNIIRDEAAAIGVHDHSHEVITEEE